MIYIPTELLLSYRFYVLIGQEKIGFSKVSGLKTKVNFDAIVEGGRNGSPLMVKAAAKQSGRLTFERGVYKDSTLIEKYPAGFSISAAMTVVLLDSSNKISAKFAVENPIVEEWELGELDALKSGVVIERLSVVHYGISKA